MFEDFPAAHSMDSGWFAVDKNGRIAHFSTGEGGAMPGEGGFTTGEAGVGDEDTPRLYWEQVLPWMARHMDGDEIRKHVEDLFALYDTADHARAAAEALGTEVVDENPLFVTTPFDGDDWSQAPRELAGFVGYAPGPFDIEFENLPPELSPIAMYTHGEWEIPGHYVRLSAGASDFRVSPVPEKMARMDTDFTEAAEIQLADFYSDDECVSWSEADLRTGAMDSERADGGAPKQGFFGWLFNVLRGGS